MKILSNQAQAVRSDYLKPNVNKVFFIENHNNGPSFKLYAVDQLFTHLKQEQEVYADSIPIRKVKRIYNHL